MTFHLHRFLPCEQSQNHLSMHTSSQRKYKAAKLWPTHSKADIAANQHLEATKCLLSVKQRA